MTGSETPVDRWTATRAVVALVAVFVGVAVVNAIATPVFLPPDEHAHIAYGYALTELELPTISDPQAGGPYTYDSDRTIYTANHPPLHHLLLGPTVRALNTVVAPDTAIRMARLLSVVAGALGIAATAGLFLDLARHRTSIAITATGLVVAVPDLSYRFSHVYNDALAYATGMAALWAGIRIHDDGITTRRTVLLAAAATAACLTRASAVPFAVAGVALAAWSVGRTTAPGQRCRRLLRLAFAIGTPVILIAAPFHVRNLLLYGDLTGSGELFDLVGRVPAPFSTVIDPRQLASTYRNMWITGPDTAGAAVEIVAWTSAIVFWAVAIAAGVGLVRLLAAWVRGAARDRIAPTVAASFVVASVLGGFAQHVMGGGLPHARYLFGAFFAVAGLAALGTDLAPRFVPPTVVGAALLGSLWASTVRVDRMLSTYWFPDLPDRAERWRMLAGELGPASTIVMVGAAAAALSGVGVLVPTLARLRSDERVRARSNEPERPAP